MIQSYKSKCQSRALLSDSNANHLQLVAYQQHVLFRKLSQVLCS